MTGFKSKRTAALDKLAQEHVSKDEALKLALEALEKVTTELLAIRDELAERGARPTTNIFHQRLWDSSFKAYTGHALPASTAIKEALAQPAQKSLKEMTEADFDAAHDIGQPAQEPVAHVIVIGDMVSVSTGSSGLKDLFELGNGAPLYTTPLQRPWVGLTDEDFQPAVQKAMMYYGYEPKHSTLTSGAGFYVLVRDIETKLKEKNT